MANVTLSISEELLNRGRDYALKRGTSLNALIRSLLAEAVSKPDAAVDSMIRRLAETEGDSGGVRYSREELHRF